VRRKGEGSREGEIGAYKVVEGGEDWGRGE